MVIVMDGGNALPVVTASGDNLDHNRLLVLINSMADGVVAVDENLKVALTNSQALEVLDVNELRGKQLNQILDLVDKNDAKIDIETLVSKISEPFNTRDWRLKYKDGSLINLAFNVSPVHLSFGRQSNGGWVILLRDITAEKSLEEEREDFISVASHELRTPITIAEGNVSNAMMLVDKGGSMETMQKTLSVAHDQIIFLGNLINDLAMLSRADRGKLALSIESFDVKKMIEVLASDYRSQAEKKGLQLIVLADDELGSLSSSQLYVREILQNFITNSLKYTVKGSITLSAKPLKNGIEFSVSDTGIGISKSEQAKLFSKFFRSDDWRVKKISGTGLGLYVTGKLIRLLGGQISQESQLDEGTEFKVFIPNTTDTSEPLAKSPSTE
jgi:two-component system, OmpR family, phosphate regulon sensor histidine kinase PhoR